MVWISACEMVPLLRRGGGRPQPAPELPTGALAFEVRDPPARAIRLSFLHGAISFRAAGTDAWARAELNRPLVEGDALWVDVADRAELDLASAALRMDARTSLELLRFDDRVAQAKVTEGVIGVAVRRSEPDAKVENAALEVDTPNAAVTLLAPGTYRLDIEPDIDTTFVTVRSGEAEVSGTHLEFKVRPGQRVQISGPDAMEYGSAAEPATDGFDRFCESRERRLERSISARYVAAEVNGYSELDDSGAWREDAALGPVWTPRSLPAGWTPYRFGHWAWIEPWGWTWIDDAPWGFAPFHYGRWAFLDGASGNGTWSWVPGPRDVRPVYAPALAVFARWRDREVRQVAWFPLAPGEAYVPAYGCSAPYLENLNPANTHVRRYANLSVDGAVAAAPHEAFVRGESPGLAAVTASQLIIVPAAPVAPIAESLAPRRDRFVMPPPERTQTTAVVGRREPALRPIPFGRREPMLHAHPGLPLESGEIEKLRRTGPEGVRTDVRPARLHPTGVTAGAGE